MTERLETSTRYQPVNQRVLIKVITDEYPTLNIMAGTKPSETTHTKLFIAGTSVEGYNIGDEVLVDPSMFNSGNSKIYDDENEYDLFKIQEHLKSLKKSEYEELLKTTPKFTVINYMVIHHASITCIVKPKVNKLHVVSGVDTLVNKMK